MAPADHTADPGIFDPSWSQVQVRLHEHFDEHEWLNAQQSKFFTEFLGAGGEGRATTMRGSEGERPPPSTKGKFPEDHGSGHAESHGTPLRAQRHHSKRSFTRALKRLHQTGFCVYRGRVHVQAPHASTTMPSRSKPSCEPKRAPGPRLNCISWNCGGLTSEAYHELLVWLSLHSIDICLLQGTRWALVEPWASNGFAFVPSPPQANGHDGLLTIIKTQLCAPDAISHATALAGRLQHVRCHMGCIAIDIVNCYQHPNIPTKNRPDPTSARDEFWQAWEHLLARLPFRNLLLVAGDFNCSMDKPKAHRFKQVQYPDQETFKTVINRFSLASVRAHDSYHSYQGPAGKSNIDYVFARRPQLDQLARQACCLRSFPVNSHRDYPDHSPIACTIPLNWKAWQCQQKQHTTHLNRHTIHHMRQEWDAASPTWLAFEEHMDQELRQAAGHCDTPDCLTNTVVRVCAEHFRVKREPPEAVWNMHSTRSLVAQKWRHLHLARHPQSHACPTRQVFQAWAHAVKFMRLRTQLRRHCKAHKRARIQKVIQEATHAASRHDAKSLYLAIRTLTPKQPRHQIRFRQAGMAQSPQDELDHLLAHFEAIFRATSSELPPLSPLDVPFSQGDLEGELRAIRIDKAVAPGTIPPLLLRHFACRFAQWTHRFLSATWNQSTPCIPSTWKDATLTLLAKRTVHTPNDLRPIALTCGLGKAVLGTVIKQAQATIAPTLKTFPLFAYTAQRGVFEALCYAFDHCHQVRSICTQANPSHWQKEAGHTKPLLVGGVMLSLDLTQAFDRLPRSALYEGLLLRGCPPQIACLLVNWLKDAKYGINHRGLHANILTTCGVRQGCRGSPMEWNVFMTVILEALSAKFDMPVDQLIHRLICFADDLLLRWKIASIHDVHQAFTHIGQTLDVLESFQLVFNPKKTVILLRLEGSQAAKTGKLFLVKTNEGTFAQIPRSNGTTLIPVVHQHTYLGCQLSYHRFEQLTINHRIHIGRTAFQRLRSWLAKRHSVTSRTRAQVWRTCIFSSYTHGLAAAGLTQAGLRKLIFRCNADIRTVGQSPGHITHETNSDITHRLGIVEPLTLVKEQWLKLFDRLAQNQAQLPPHDFLRTMPLDATKQRVMSIFDQVQTDQQLWELPCPYCPQLFETMAQFNRHMIVTHKITRVHNAFQIERDALAGRPQCSHCHYRFPDWRGLRRRINDDSCPLFEPNRQLQEPPADQRIFREYAQADAWMAVIEQPELIQVLREQCVLCGKQCLTGKAMLEHLNLNHYDVWHESKIHAPVIINALRDAHPCQACGVNAPKAHACHVIRQMAIVHLLQRSDRKAKDLTPGKPIAPMPPKPAVHWQLPDSSQRIRQTPRTAQSFKSIHTYHPGRDSADGTPTCAHCQGVQGNYFALRRHIESGCCHAFNMNRPLGSHIPQTWPELLQLAKDEETDQILRQPAYVKALRAVCALCGRQCSRPGALIQHHQQDHAHMANEAQHGASTCKARQRPLAAHATVAIEL